MHLHYYRTGRVERGVPRTPREAYARVHPEGTTEFLWETRDEARARAASLGAKAVFFTTFDDAVAAARESSQYRVLFTAVEAIATETSAAIRRNRTEHDTSLLDLHATVIGVQIRVREALEQATRLQGVPVQEG